MKRQLQPHADTRVEPANKRTKPADGSMGQPRIDRQVSTASSDGGYDSALYDFMCHSPIRSRKMQKTSPKPPEPGSVVLTAASGTTFPMSRDAARLSHYITAMKKPIDSAGGDDKPDVPLPHIPLPPSVSDECARCLLDLAEKEGKLYAPDLTGVTCVDRLAELFEASKFLDMPVICTAVGARLFAVLVDKFRHRGEDAEESIFTPPPQPGADPTPPMLARSASIDAADDAIGHDEHAIVYLLKQLDLSALCALKRVSPLWSDRAREALCAWRDDVHAASDHQALSALIRRAIANPGSTPPAAAQDVALVLAEKFKKCGQVLPETPRKDLASRECIVRECIASGNFVCLQAIARAIFQEAAVCRSSGEQEKAAMALRDYSGPVDSVVVSAMRSRDVRTILWLREAEANRSRARWMSAQAIEVGA